VIVLDTHIWLHWVIEGENSLPTGIVQAIQTENRVAVSAISCFEVAYLLKRQRIELPVPLQDWLSGALGPAGIECLPITCEIARDSARLPDHHKDPADRIIIATALAHDARLTSLDNMFPAYDELAGRLLQH
jgi:PIN domain nuclease of toxin-antitoxin system